MVVPTPRGQKRKGTDMQTDTHTKNAADVEKKPADLIHVFVKRGQTQVKVEFTTTQATGLDIKTKAGGSAQDGLYFSKGGKDQEVGDDEVVDLKDGMHFTLIPNGRVS